MFLTISIVVKPPFITKSRWGKSYFKRRTQSYFRGGIVRLSLGESPFNKHFLACIINFLIPPTVDTIVIKLCTFSYLSRSSTPSRHFTVTGILTFFYIA